MWTGAWWSDRSAAPVYGSRLVCRGPQGEPASRCRRRSSSFDYGSPAYSIRVDYRYLQRGQMKHRRPLPRLTKVVLRWLGRKLGRGPNGVDWVHVGDMSWLLLRSQEVP